jgi:hypothetical protein
MFEQKEEKGKIAKYNYFPHFNYTTEDALRPNFFFK